jgi:hypothetical protein
MIPIQLSKVSGFHRALLTGSSGPSEEHVIHVSQHAESGSTRQALRLFWVSRSPPAAYLQTAAGTGDARLRTCTARVVLG